MRILHVVGKLDRGGAETWLVQALRHMDRTKCQMDFVVHTIAPGAYDKDVRTLGSRIIPCLKPSNPLRYAWNFYRILRTHGPYDVVHSHVHHYSGYVLWLAKQAGVRVRVAHSHSDTSGVDRRANALRRAYLHLMVRLVDRSCTHGIAVSRWAGDSLFTLGWQQNGRFFLLPCGLDLEPFRERTPWNANARELLGIPRGNLVVGHVGRFTAEKNHQFLAQVAREVIALEQAVTFLLVGDGPLRPAVEKSVKRNGLERHFLFVGVRNDVPKLMKHAMDIFFLPSLHEGLSIALLEAQAAGLPCLISDRIPPEANIFDAWVLRENLNNSPLAWARSLLRLATKGRHRLSADEWRRLERERSIATSIEKIISIYTGSVYAGCALSFSSRERVGGAGCRL